MPSLVCSAQVGRIFLTTVSTFALVPLKTVVSSPGFTVFVIYSASDAIPWLVGPTREPTNTAKSTRKGSSLLKRSIYIWKRATTTMLHLLRVKGRIAFEHVRSAGVVNLLLLDNDMRQYMSIIRLVVLWMLPAICQGVL